METFSSAKRNREETESLPVFIVDYLAVDAVSKNLKKAEVKMAPRENFSLQAADLSALTSEDYPLTP